MYAGSKLTHEFFSPGEKNQMDIATYIREASRVEPKVILKMIRQGQNVNTKDDEGKSPLHYAARHGVKIAKVLLDHGADINVKNDQGVTPLMIAIEYSFENDLDESLVRFFVNNGADVCRSKDEDGQTPLHHVREMETLKLLMNRGSLPLINHQDNYGNTPLMLASKYGREEMVEELIRLGANVEIKTKYGHTAMSFINVEQTGDEMNIIPNIFILKLKRLARFRFYNLGQLFQQKQCGLVVMTKVCRYMLRGMNK
jgi:ankyrin repeat protein